MIQAADRNIGANTVAYVDGTSAKAYKYDVYEENRVLKRKKEQKASSRAKLKAVLLIFTIFALFLLVTLRYGFIIKMGYDIDRYGREYNQLKDSNLKLAIGIEKDLDLNKVRQIAETRLGMQKPDNAQVVYVKVPKSDMTVLGNEEDRKSGMGGMFASLFSRLGEFTHLVY